ncbi:uncharacterized protein LOC129577653 [Sitodiplosis mosellana]|uniref:uncharacterized protein LOC129577653 n=1 Tax=Sitodiplosis mosellana TaxID=263140 RepID=UPI002444FBAE|nr:uncharacterized protein LOC129577653 [Sitodiplosis mosellana]
MIDNLIGYLSKRPIAPILQSSAEKDDLRALKLMSVIDYYTEQRTLYAKMTHQPKLQHHLQDFHSYANFKYYDCQVNSAIGKRLLQCKFCELVAPYALVLIHMAINHNNHISTKTCAYCNRLDIVAHVKDESLQNCYNKYLKTFGLRPETIITEVTVEFYKLLRDLAKSLGVIVARNDTFAGIGYARIEPVIRKIPNFPRTCKVFSPKNSSKVMDNDQLDEYFEMVMGFMLGGNGISRLIQNTTSNQGDTADDTIVILSDDDDDNQENGNNPQRPTNHAVNTILPNIVVKTEQMDIENEPLASNETDANLPPEPVIRPIVVQVRDETPRRAEQSPQLLRLENESQPPQAGPPPPPPPQIGTPHTGLPQIGTPPNNATTAERTVTEADIQKENTGQPANAVPPKMEVPEMRIKLDPGADDFGRYVANRLSGLMNPIKRRKLELRIQQNIVDIEREDIEAIE